MPSPPKTDYLDKGRGHDRRLGIEARWCSWDSIGLFMVLARDLCHSTSAQSF